MWSEMAKLKGDVICIQETHFMTSKQPKCSHKAYPHIFQSTAPVKKRGVLLAIKHSVAFKLHDLVCDTNGRYIILTCDLNNATYTLVNLYATKISELSTEKSKKNQKRISDSVR